MSPIPKVHYISDRRDLSFPSYHMGRCDKILSGGSVKRDHFTGEGYCCKPGKAAIFWIDPEVYHRRRISERYYCADHLDDRMREVFKSGEVTVRQADGSDKKMSLNEIIAKKADKK